MEANEYTLSPDEFRQFIKEKLRQKIAKNPQYSLRAFARSLEISHSALSLMLSGRRRITPKLAAKISQCLNVNVKIQLEKKDLGEGYAKIDLDIFNLISQWQHYAILSLLDLSEAKFEKSWISKRLGISERLAEASMRRLIRLKLIGRLRNGRWKQTHKPIKVENVKSTLTTQQFHRQMLRKAVESMYNDPSDERDFSSITFAASRKDIPFAREKIREFRRELCHQLEDRGQKTDVYNLTVQIYPVTKKLTNAEVRK